MNSYYPFACEFIGGDPAKKEEGRYCCEKVFEEYSAHGGGGGGGGGGADTAKKEKGRFNFIS